MGRLLVVASDYPYPPRHGPAVDMWNRILALKRLGFTLDLIATVKTRPKEEDFVTVQHTVDKLWVVERNRGILALLSLEPFQVRSRKKLRDIVLTESYEVVLLESEYVASVLKNEHLKAKVRVLRAENDEARFFRELGKSVEGWKERLFYRLEAAKFDRFSPQVKSKCDLIWFISDHEMQDHVRRRPEDVSKAMFLPPDPGIKHMSPYSGGGEEVLFIGSLTHPPNVEGLKWYIEHVHPGLSKTQRYSFTIAGRTNGAVEPTLKGLVKKHGNISLYTDPADLTGLYARAAVFVNPVLRGAGVKVKTIHALHAGVPVVSTSIGMEGTGLISGKHLLVADSPNDFISSVITILEGRSFARTLVDSAQSFLAETYDQEKRITGSLSTIFPEPSSICL